MPEDRKELDVLFDEALKQYKEFLLNNNPTDQRSFIEHQSACKAALGHLLMLDKLKQEDKKTIDHDMLYQGEAIERLLRESFEALNDCSDDEDFDNN